MPRPPPPIVLAFAGSDPSSGAGIQADLLTLAARGCHPLAVVTAITVQDTTGVEAVQAVEARWVIEQARRVLDDMSVGAVKIGLIGSSENAAAIARVVADYVNVPVVLDPVLASGRGDQLADAETIEALRKHLIPRATVLTPNSIEARRLAFFDEDGQGADRALDVTALRLLERGAEFVLVTGTHEPTASVVNTLYGRGGTIRSDRWDRLPENYHGSGCTLASAIAAALARGLAVPEAVRDAQEYVWQTLVHAFRPGRGQSLPNRFYWARGGERLGAED